MMKKLLILLFISYIQCRTEEENYLLNKRQMQCIEEMKVNPSYVLKLKAGNWRNEHVHIKKWCLCLLNKYDYMSKEGVFKMDTALSRVPDIDKPHVERLIDECLPKKSKEPYDIAWEYIKCYHHLSKDKKHKDGRYDYLYLL